MRKSDGMGISKDNMEPVRLVCLGRPDRSDSASITCLKASEFGAVSRHIFDEGVGGMEEIDQGGIEWGRSLGSAHWLINCSSTPLQSEGARGAWSASMTFAELEGTKVVMVVDPPKEGFGFTESWGHVITKIRQIHLLFIHPDALQAISEIEATPEEDLLGEIRSRSLVPLVCSYSPDSRAIIEHALGRTNAESESEMDCLEWLAGFLCILPLIGSGIVGIEEAATVAGKKK